MKSDKRQTLALIGIAMLAGAAVLIYISLTLPKVYEVSTAPAQTVVVTQTENATAASVTAAPSTATKAAATQLQVSYPLNLNTATMEELQTIDGLGAERAYAIVQYREYLGGYTSVEQIMEIKGIGESVYQQAAPYLTV